MKSNHVVHDKVFSFYFEKSDITAIIANSKVFAESIAAIVFLCLVVYLIFMLVLSFSDRFLFGSTAAVAAIFLALELVMITDIIKGGPVFVANLKAEQKIYFTVNGFVYECGSLKLEVERKYLWRIVQTPNFYRIDLYLSRQDEVFLSGERVTVSSAP